MNTRNTNFDVVEKLEQRVIEVKEIIKNNLDLLDQFLDSPFPGRTTLTKYVNAIPQSYMDTDQMELNEILYPSVYNMRILINVLCYFIKGAFPYQYQYILDRYIRHSEVPVVDYKSYIDTSDLKSEQENINQQSEISKILKIELGQDKKITKPASRSDSIYF